VRALNPGPIYHWSWTRRAAWNRETVIQFGTGTIMISRGRVDGEAREETLVRSWNPMAVGL